MKKKLFVFLLLIVAFIFLGFNFYNYVLSYPVIINNEKFYTRDTNNLVEIIERKYQESNKIKEEELNKFRNVNIELPTISTTFFDILQNDIINNKTYSYNIVDSYNYNEIENYLELKNKSLSPSTNASISINDLNEYVIIKESYGNQIDVNSFLNDFKNNKNISYIDYYKKPSIFIDDLQETYDDYKKIKEWEINYSNGTKLNIPNENILYENNKFSVDTTFLKNQLDDLINDYNTKGKYMDFQSTEDGIVQIKNETWGAEIDLDKEIEYIESLINNKTSEDNRIPIYKTNKNEIGDTYVEVNKEKQHVWVYIDGELWGESDCVTGNKSNHDTPIGTYYITECINGKYLTGPGYKSWVNKWMRLTNSGIGLHDATWRSKFGGNIYQGDGSHGCINLPKKFAYELYDVAYVGMPTIIY